MLSLLNILSLGGGVQSSRILEESICGDLPKLDAAIFADTGWEPAAVYAHVEYLFSKARAAGIRCERVAASNIRADALNSHVRGKKQDGVRWASLPYYTMKVWQPTREDIAILEACIAELEGRPANGTAFEIDAGRYLWIADEGDAAQQFEATKLRRILEQLRVGKPVEQAGMIKRQCTSEYKIEPIERFIKTELLGLGVRDRWPKEPVVRQWFGISADESRRCRASTAKWKTHWYPLVDRHIDRAACLRWFLEKGLPVPPRSACIGCPFHSDAEWRDMQLNRPGEFRDACEFDESIRNCGGRRGQVFLHAARVPLRTIDFRGDVERGQRLLMLDDRPRCDEGHCFV